MECINNFRGEYRFLSNFYDSPFLLNNQLYQTVEHYYQSMKTDNEEEKCRILACSSPEWAKIRGRQATIRSDWDEIKVSVMYTGLKTKFRYGSLRQRLIDTGRAQLIESNYWHDNFWGSCICPKCKDTWGKNILGSLLMIIRGDSRECTKS